MKIAITGASGFIGRRVVEHALGQGHDVVALMRSQPSDTWQSTPKLTIQRCDLNEPQGLGDALTGCDVVIHLAAVMSGNRQYEDTIKATQNILHAMNEAGVNRLVGCSSIAVLDYARQAPMSIIDNNAPTNEHDGEIGPYAKMKRDQEKLFQNWQTGEKSLVILRPGIVYEKGNLSDAHAGYRFLGAMHQGEVPVVHLNSVAEAFVAAASSEVNNEVLHLLNDNLPTQSQYLAKLKTNGTIGSLAPLPWKLFSLLMACIRLPLTVLGKVPDSFRRNSVAARQKPFQFSNQTSKQLLGWQPSSAIED